MNEPIIEYRGVTVEYRQTRTTALQDVNLQIHEGEFVFLIGHSGAGKSTMLNLLLRAVSPTRGQVWFGGENLARYRMSRLPYHRRRIGMVFQNHLLLPSLSAYENVAFALRVIGAPPRSIPDRATSALRQVGLAHKRNNLPIQLSIGEQQRVTIARALVTNPPVLLADEPTGNLDVDTAWEIFELLDDINRKDTTVVVATHSREMVDRLRRRVVALRRGRIFRDEARGGYDANLPPATI